jgi:hypothetical protein
MTAGQAVASELRRYFSVGSRTRRNRGGQNLPKLMIEAIRLAACAPGYYSERTHEILRPAFGAALAYEKHVDGYRIDGTLAYTINSVSPWQFASLIGQMVDAGVTNNGEGERFFQKMGRLGAAPPS